MARDNSPPYLFLVATDATFAFGMMAAGVGLRNERSWAPKLSMALAGPLLITSVGMGLLLLPRFLNAGTAAPRNAELAFLPRLLYYLINIGFWPYLVRQIIRHEPADSRRPLWAFFGSSMVLGMILTGLLYVLLRVF